MLQAPNMTQPSSGLLTLVQALNQGVMILLNFTKEQLPWLAFPTKPII